MLVIIDAERDARRLIEFGRQKENEPVHLQPGITGERRFTREYDTFCLTVTMNHRRGRLAHRKRVPIRFKQLRA